MALKCIVLAALVGACSAGVISSPLAVAVDSEYDPHPAYSYAYDVQDALTGDSKRQQEHRDGDVVRGSYSLNDPDGTRRTVDYAADPVNGFNAVVRREPQTSVTIAAPAALTVAQLAGAQLTASPLTAPAPTLAVPTLAVPALAVSSTSSSRVDAPSGLSVAVPRLISAGSPFVSAGVQQLQLQQLRQLQPQQLELQQLRQLQPQQLEHLRQLQPQQLVNSLALATNLGLAGLSSPIIHAAPWA